MQKILENALEIGRKYIPEGECASYIPELAKADKNHLGVCIRTRGMETFSAGCNHSAPGALPHGSSRNLCPVQRYRFCKPLVCFR